MRHTVTPRTRRVHHHDWTMVVEVFAGIAFIALGMFVALGTLAHMGPVTVAAGLLVCVAYCVVAREGSGS